MNPVFWFVWNENGGMPQVKHANLSAARREAERLARNNPGQTFHVLELVGSCKKTDVEWMPCEDTEARIPF